MSAKATRYVWDHLAEAGTTRLRLVWLAVADEADDDGVMAAPDITRLARKARLTEKRTQRAIDEMIFILGLLESDQNGAIWIRGMQP